jgi:5-methylcytosine-specific restriction enzyme subunit McrC
LREALGSRASHLVHGGRGRQLTMGVGGEIQLWPDLSWWDGSRCRFVADVKYKTSADIRHAQPGDLYQLLTYATSANVPSGMLIHAAGAANVSGLVTRHSGKRLHSVALDLRHLIELEWSTCAWPQFIVPIAVERMRVQR